jgi:hypothetical protein
VRGEIEGYGAADAPRRAGDQGRLGRWRLGHSLAKGGLVRRDAYFNSIMLELMPGFEGRSQSPNFWANSSALKQIPPLKLQAKKADFEYLIANFYSELLKCDGVVKETRSTVILA